MTHKHRYEQGYLGKMFSKVRLAEHEAHKLSAPEENSEQEQRDNDKAQKALKQEETRLGRELTKDEVARVFWEIMNSDDSIEGDDKGIPE